VPSRTPNVSPASVPSFGNCRDESLTRKVYQKLPDISLRMMLIART